MADESDDILLSLRNMFSENGEDILESLRSLFGDESVGVNEQDENVRSACVRCTRCVICFLAFTVDELVSSFDSCTHLLHTDCYSQMCRTLSGHNLLCPLDRSILQHSADFKYVFHEGIENDEGDDEDVDVESRSPLPALERQSCGHCTLFFEDYEMTKMIVLCGHCYHEGCLTVVESTVYCLRCDMAYDAADVMDFTVPPSEEPDVDTPDTPDIQNLLIFLILWSMFESNAAEDEGSDEDHGSDGSDEDEGSDEDHGCDGSDEDEGSDGSDEDEGGDVF